MQQIVGPAASVRPPCGDVDHIPRIAIALASICVRKYRMRSLLSGLLISLAALLGFSQMVLAQTTPSNMQVFTVPSGSHPHDVAPATDGGVWFTAQSAGYLGWLDPGTGEVRQTLLGRGSAPHGVITGPDGAPWITDGGLNAIVRVDPATGDIRTFPLPVSQNVSLNTSTFDPRGVLWFTGQSGFYGRLDPNEGEVHVNAAPRGPGAYGMTTTPGGGVFFASLASSYLGQIDTQSSQATAIDPPTAGQGARRVWTDAQGRLWITEWNAGQLARYDPVSGEWREWRLPTTARAMPYAVYVDDQGLVWLSDWTSNAILVFNPETETFQSYPISGGFGGVRQMNGRHGEVWAAESAVDKLLVIRT
jgi:virginiamycin B lyase